MESVFLWVITSEKNNASQFILLEDQKVLKDHNSSQKPDVSFLQFGDGNQYYSGWVWQHSSEKKLTEKKYFKFYMQMGKSTRVTLIKCYQFKK